VRNSLKLSVALVAATALVNTAAQAQTSGSINATATVLSALTVTGTNLAFGNVAPTQTKVVAAAAGGTFTVAGSAGAPVLFNFTLPATLGTNVGIGSWTGIYNNQANSSSGGGATAFVPSATQQSTTLSGVAGNGNVWVWVGATLTTTGAATGTYTSPVTLTVIYN
jgi:hypothetical protein